MPLPNDRRINFHPGTFTHSQSISSADFGMNADFGIEPPGANLRESAPSADFIFRDALHSSIWAQRKGSVLGSRNIVRLTSRRWSKLGAGSSRYALTPSRARRSVPLQGLLCCFGQNDARSARVPRHLALRQSFHNEARFAVVDASGQCGRISRILNGMASNSVQRYRAINPPAPASRLNPASVRSG